MIHSLFDGNDLFIIFIILFCFNEPRELFGNQLLFRYLVVLSYGDISNSFIPFSLNIYIFSIYLYMLYGICWFYDISLLKEKYIWASKFYTIYILLLSH
jgi:hypothetical protein